MNTMLMPRSDSKTKIVGITPKKKNSIGLSNLIHKQK